LKCKFAQDNNSISGNSLMQTALLPGWLKSHCSCCIFMTHISGFLRCFKDPNWVPKNTLKIPDVFTRIRLTDTAFTIHPDAANGACVKTAVGHKPDRKP